MRALPLVAPGPVPTSPPPGRCPACRGARLGQLIEIVAAPVHTSTLLATRAQALAYPRADIRLALCLDCGFVTNTAFNAEGHDYSASYEEVQAHSARFRAYADELAATLVQRHGLGGRDVFEIGCGRGDFLRVLVGATGGSASAVDPSFRPTDLTGQGAERITVQRKFFEPADVPPGVAAVLSRHVLEHIHDTAGFLGLVRDGVARSPDAVVVFEVPDTLRVLDETAFWDVFYEHCAYFTPGSLARAFRRAGLEPTALGLTFDDQYVLVTARAGAPGAGEPLPLEETADASAALARSFASAVERERERWAGLLRSARARGETCVIWGAGSKGVGFLSALGLDGEIACAVDVNPAKHGMFMPGTGHEIVPPEALVDVRPNLVVVMNPAYVEEIRADLDRLGVAAEVMAL
jgi:hypothetical protein